MNLMEACLSRRRSIGTEAARRALVPRRGGLPQFQRRLPFPYASRPRFLLPTMGAMVIPGAVVAIGAVVAAMMLRTVVATGAMGAMGAQNRREMVRRTVAPDMMPPTMMATVTPMVAMSLWRHFVPHPVENTRGQSMDDHLAGTEGIVVPAAVMMSFTSRHRLDAESEKCQCGWYCRS